ncbi:MAG: class B sortase [Lachnospiraceae bacterium]|nr:class B sortase [Lachnospiraceae bacterium]
MKRNVGIITIGLVVVAVGIGVVGYQVWQDAHAKATYHEISTSFVVEAPEEASDQPWYEACEVDFAGLQEVNPDVVGWIYIEGNDTISYPILQGDSDETYLHTNLYGEQLKSGSIFLESGNQADFSDMYTLIYGHNMRDGSMFGSLKHYRDEEVLERSPYITIVTPECAYRYEIFGFEDVAEDDRVYTVGFGADDTYGEFLDYLYSKSEVKTDVVATKEDRVITLSTCSSSGRRFVVHGVLVDTHSAT